MTDPYQQERLSDRHRRQRADTLAAICAGSPGVFRDFFHQLPQSSSRPSPLSSLSPILGPTRPTATSSVSSVAAPGTVAYKAPFATYKGQRFFLDPSLSLDSLNPFAAEAATQDSSIIYLGNDCYRFPTPPPHPPQPVETQEVEKKLGTWRRLRQKESRLLKGSEPSHFSGGSIPTVSSTVPSDSLLRSAVSSAIVDQNREFPKYRSIDGVGDLRKRTEIRPDLLPIPQQFLRLEESPPGIKEKIGKLFRSGKQTEGDRIRRKIKIIPSETPNSGGYIIERAPAAVDHSTDPEESDDPFQSSLGDKTIEVYLENRFPIPKLQPDRPCRTQQESSTKAGSVLPSQLVTPEHAAASPRPSYYKSRLQTPPTDFPDLLPKPLSFTRVASNPTTTSTPILRQPAQASNSKESSL